MVGLPFQVHGGDVKDHALQPQDHEEALGEGTVPDALSITPRLDGSKGKHNQDVNSLVTPSQVNQHTQTDTHTHTHTNTDTHTLTHKHTHTK